MKRFKYLTNNERDELWGLTVSTVGSQKIAPDCDYPPKGHNSEYMFNPLTGRILNEFQLIYISEGSGCLETAHCSQTKVCAGDLILLFPDEWHSYRPTKKDGWTEYWIGFYGENIEKRVANGFFSKEKSLFHIGLNEEIISLYNHAIEAANEQMPFFQQLLAGYVNHLLGILFVTDNRLKISLTDQDVETINKAKVFMEESIEENIDIPRVASYVGCSYSSFRRLFKQYTGKAPGQFFSDLKLHRAKELLRNSNISIKEIAIRLNFDSPEYFSTLFRKRFGITPVQYRNS